MGDVLMAIGLVLVGLVGLFALGIVVFGKRQTYERLLRLVTAYRGNR